MELVEGSRVRLNDLAIAHGIHLGFPGRTGTVVNTPARDTPTCQVRWDGHRSASRYAKAFLEPVNDDEALRLVRSGIINTIADAKGQPRTNIPRTVNAAARTCENT